jgi:hypothetical protein
MPWRKMEGSVVALISCQASRLDWDGDSRISQGWRWLMLYRQLQQDYRRQYLITDIRGATQQSTAELGTLTESCYT